MPPTNQDDYKDLTQGLTEYFGDDMAEPLAQFADGLIKRIEARRTAPTTTQPAYNPHPAGIYAKVGDPEAARQLAVQAEERDDQILAAIHDGNDEAYSRLSGGRRLSGGAKR